METALEKVVACTSDGSLSADRNRVNSYTRGLLGQPGLSPFGQ
jgi:hypothetical protein